MLTTPTTPSTVPSFTPQVTTARAMTAVSNVHPRIKQDERNTLSKKEKDALQTSATETLSNKFNLMTVTLADNHNEKLTSTYKVNMTLQEFFVN